MSLAPTQLTAVLALTRQAGNLIMASYQQAINVEIKSDNSPVTEIDKAVATFLTAGLLAIFPDDITITEETWRQPPSDKNIWLIDPIDGTKAFIAGIDTFSIIIGRATPTQWAVFGLQYFPVTDELFYSTDQGIIYCTKGTETVIPPYDFDWPAYWRKSMRETPETELIRERMHWTLLSSPNGHANKVFLLDHAKILAFGHGYTYELCAFDALVQAVGGVLISWTGTAVDYYTADPKICWWRYLGSQKAIEAVTQRT